VHEAVRKDQQTPACRQVRQEFRKDARRLWGRRFIPTQQESNFSSATGKNHMLPLAQSQSKRPAITSSLTLSVITWICLNSHLFQDLHIPSFFGSTACGQRCHEMNFTLLNASFDEQLLVPEPMSYHTFTNSNDAAFFEMTCLQQHNTLLHPFGNLGSAFRNGCSAVAACALGLREQGFPNASKQTAPPLPHYAASRPWMGAVNLRCDNVMHQEAGGHDHRHQRATIPRCETTPLTANPHTFGSGLVASGPVQCNLTACISEQFALANHTYDDAQKWKCPPLDLLGFDDERALMRDTIQNHTLMVSRDMRAASSRLDAECVLSDAVVLSSTENYCLSGPPLLKEVNRGLVTASTEEVLDPWPLPVGCQDHPPSWSFAVTTLRPLWTLQELLGPGWEAIGSFQPIRVSLNLAGVVVIGLLNNLLLLLGAVLTLRWSKRKDRYKWQGLSAMLGALLMLQAMLTQLNYVRGPQAGERRHREPGGRETQVESAPHWPGPYACNVHPWYAPGRGLA